ncbi:MAG: hypothetical protein ACYTGH_16030 [Planctomycetota bacterium]|jgi:hypothetical protein
MAEGEVNTIEHVEGFYSIIPFTPLRRTENVTFDAFPIEALAHIDAIDRVIHGSSAFSPGAVDDVARPWYMHPCQADNLLVFQGTRHVEIFKPGFGEIQSFTVTKDRVEKNGETVYDGPAVVVWATGVFHRVETGPEGSVSINLAVHYDGFDIDTNFNIYDLDPATGEFHVIREGHLDQ